MFHHGRFRAKPLHLLQRTYQLHADVADLLVLTARIWPEGDLGVDVPSARPYDICTYAGYG